MKKRSIELKDMTFVQKKIWKFFIFMDSIILIILSAVIYILRTFYAETTRTCYLIVLLVLVSTLLLNFALVDFLFMIFSKDFEKLSSVKLVNEHLSTQEHTEVIPTDGGHKYTYFFACLTNIAKFYAIIDSSSTVTVYVLYNNEKEFRFLEQLSKELFSSYYKIK